MSRLYGMVSVNDPFRRLGAESRNSRDIVGGISHKRLKVDKFQRSNIPLLLNILRIVIEYSCHTLCSLRKAYLYLLITELKEIPVTRNYGDQNALCLSPLRHCSQKVICLEASLRKNRDMHGCKDFLNHRNLLVELLRHGSSGALVRREHFVSEGRLMYIKCHRKMIRLLLIQYLEQYVQESVNRICMQPL